MNKLVGLFVFCSTCTTSQLPKVLREQCVLYMLTWNVLRATTACTFSTSELPKQLVCFAHFDFQMCFAPERRAKPHLSSSLFAFISYIYIYMCVCILKPGTRSSCRRRCRRRRRRRGHRRRRCCFSCSCFCS